ncbi:MAG: HD domain-containing protein [Polyangia bacterium]|jgi:HD-GYP domain-containing protein (c-di-GMP phosphodiesterase class II)|nr:HD domain-containing protein [Polyangia bacterium]
MNHDIVEHRNMASEILSFIEELNHLQHVDTILDRILLKARQLTHADAGSIFLMEDGDLRFSYVHNDTLYKADAPTAATYADFRVPIDESSIVGFAAKTRRTLAIDDAYALVPDRPYQFNPSYDEKMGYRTTSILTIPLVTMSDKLVGVMQIINAKDDRGQSVPFSSESQAYLPLLANNAAVAIERGIMNRELVLRMMKMAELRDPTETGAHVQRVGTYSAEIYRRWAMSRGVEHKELARTADHLRLAAMLHDVGKVGISDFILKKPGRLTDEEFSTMKWHTVFGARLFVNPTSVLDEMCYDISLGHHEKWAAPGYPGQVKNILSDEARMGEPILGEAIPLSARIVALADVYDALSSRRSYKDPWPEERVLGEIRKDSGTHFDPSVVEAFLQIHEVILAIRARYREAVKD